MLQCWCLDPPTAFHFNPVVVLWRRPHFFSIYSIIFFSHLPHLFYLIISLGYALLLFKRKDRNRYQKNIFFFCSSWGCRLLGYLIPFATYTLVPQCQELFIYRAMPSPLLFPTIFSNFIPRFFRRFICSPKFLQWLRRSQFTLFYYRLSITTWIRNLFKINNAIPPVLPRLLAQVWPGYCPS